MVRLANSKIFLLLFAAVLSLLMLTLAIRHMNKTTDVSDEELNNNYNNNIVNKTTKKSKNKNN